jgi:regulatory protein
MPTVTALKPQKNGKRVNVYLDGKFGFGIDLDNLVLNHIKINKEFSDEEITEIVKKAEFQKTLDKLYQFCIRRPRSQKEVIDWFRRKKVHISMQEGLIKKLKNLDLLNDKEFAKWWVEQRINFKNKSKRVIKMELQQKGIDPNIVEDSLSDTKIDEEKMARQLIDKKMYKWEKLDSKIKKQKMSQYLSAKGFSWETIEKIL